MGAKDHLSLSPSLSVYLLGWRTVCTGPPGSMHISADFLRLGAGNRPFSTVSYLALRRLPATSATDRVWLIRAWSG
ncbi:hypothetical protein LY76DRAFT_592542 [Colletotrichum caudatum]|nr:hypothetical protein LY76DRAFT_592542 [Colletotrichum caudatum]